jgi:hypothetical protein
MAAEVVGLTVDKSVNQNTKLVNVARVHLAVIAISL